MATVYREVWTGEIIKGFNAGLKDTFLDGVKDFSQYVTGDDVAQVIHSTYFGVEPEVLINNTTYPIGYQELDGEDIAINLDKYQTKATPITDDELYALSYAKMQAVKDAHSSAMVKNHLKKAIHSFAPKEASVDTPVLLTTGEVVNGRKRLTWEDIINMREALTQAEIEIEGFRLILSPEHVNDLLAKDTSLQKSYANFKDGIITNQLGFEIREYSVNPYFDAATKKKLSFGALPTATSSRASVLFPVAKTGKATGKTTMYFSEAAKDTQTQRNSINFRNYFIALPLITKGFGAIVSGRE